MLFSFRVVLFSSEIALHTLSYMLSSSDETLLCRVDVA